MVKNQDLIPNTDNAEFNAVVVGGKDNTGSSNNVDQQVLLSSSKTTSKKFLPSILSRVSKGIDGTTEVNNNPSTNNGRLKLPFLLGGMKKQNQQQVAVSSTTEVVALPSNLKTKQQQPPQLQLQQQQQKVENQIPPVENVNVRNGVMDNTAEVKSTTNSRTYSSSNESSKVSSLTDPFDIDAYRMKAGMMMIPLNPNPPVNNIFEPPSAGDNQYQIVADLSTISGSTYYNRFYQKEESVNRTMLQNQQYENSVDRRDPVATTFTNSNNRTDPSNNKMKSSTEVTSGNLEGIPVMKEKTQSAIHSPVQQPSATQMVGASGIILSNPSRGAMYSEKSGIKLGNPIPLASKKKGIAVAVAAIPNQAKIPKVTDPLPKLTHTNDPLLAFDAGRLKNEQHPVESTQPTSRKMEFGKVRALLDRVHQSGNSRSAATRPMNLPPITGSSASSLFAQRNNSGQGVNRGVFAASSSISHQDSKSVAMEQSVTTEVIANGMAAMRRRAAISTRSGRQQQQKQQEMSTSVVTTKTEIFSSVIAEADHDEETDEEKEQPPNETVGQDLINKVVKEDPSTSSSLTTRSSSSLSSINNNNDAANIQEPSSAANLSERNKQIEDVKSRLLPPRPHPPPPPPPPPLQFQRKPLEPPENRFRVNSLGNTYINRRSSIDAPETPPQSTKGDFDNQHYGSPDSSKVESLNISIISELDESQVSVSNKSSTGINVNDLDSPIDGFSPSTGHNLFRTLVKGYDIDEPTVDDYILPRDPSEVGISSNTFSRMNLLPTPTGADRNHDMNGRTDPDDAISGIQLKKSNTLGRILVQPGTDIVSVAITQFESSDSNIPIVEGVDTVFSTSSKERNFVKSSDVSELDGIFAQQSLNDKSKGEHLINSPLLSNEFWNKHGDIIDLTDPFGALQKNQKSKSATRKLKSNPFETTDEEESKTRSEDPYKAGLDELSEDEDSIPVPPSFDQSISNSRLSPMSNRWKKKGSKKISSPRRSSTRLKRSSMSNSPLTDKMNVIEHHGKKHSHENAKNVGGFPFSKYDTIEETDMPVVKANSYFEIQTQQPSYSHGTIPRQNSGVVQLPNEIAMSGEDPVSDLDQSFRHFPLKHIAADSSVDVSALDTVRYASDYENDHGNELDDDFASIRKTSLLEYSISTDGNGTCDPSHWILDKPNNSQTMFRPFAGEATMTPHGYVRTEYRNASLYQGNENMIPSVALADSATGEWTLDQRESKDTMSMDEQQRTKLMLEQHFPTNAQDLALVGDPLKSATNSSSSGPVQPVSKSNAMKEFQKLSCGAKAIVASVAPLVCAHEVANIMVPEGTIAMAKYEAANNETLARPSNNVVELRPFLNDPAPTPGTQFKVQSESDLMQVASEDSEDPFEAELAKNKVTNEEDNRDGDYLPSSAPISAGPENKNAKLGGDPQGVGMEPSNCKSQENINGYQKSIESELSDIQMLSTVANLAPKTYPIVEESTTVYSQELEPNSLQHVSDSSNQNKFDEQKNITTESHEHSDQIGGPSIISNLWSSGLSVLGLRSPRKQGQGGVFKTNSVFPSSRDDKCEEKEFNLQANNSQAQVASEAELSFDEDRKSNVSNQYGSDFDVFKQELEDCITSTPKKDELMEDIVNARDIRNSLDKYETLEGPSPEACLTPRLDDTDDAKSTLPGAVPEDHPNNEKSPSIIDLTSVRSFENYDNGTNVWILPEPKNIIVVEGKEVIQERLNNPLTSSPYSTSIIVVPGEEWNSPTDSHRTRNDEFDDIRGNDRYSVKVTSTDGAGKLTDSLPSPDNESCIDSDLPDANGWTYSRQEYSSTFSESVEYENNKREFETKASSSLPYLGLEASSINLDSTCSQQRNSTSKAIEKIVGMISFPSSKSSHDAEDPSHRSTMNLLRKESSHYRANDFQISSTTSVNSSDIKPETQNIPAKQSIDSSSGSDNNFRLELLSNGESAHFSRAMSFVTSHSDGLSFFDTSRNKVSDHISEDPPIQNSQSDQNRALPAASNDNDNGIGMQPTLENMSSSIPWELVERPIVEKQMQAISTVGDFDEATTVELNHSLTSCDLVPKAETDNTFRVDRVDRLLAKYTKSDSVKMHEHEESGKKLEINEVKPSSIPDTSIVSVTENQFDDALFALCRGTEILICGVNEFELVHNEQETEKISDTKAKQENLEPNGDNVNRKRATSDVTSSSFENDVTSIVGQGTFCSSADLSSLLKKASRELLSKRSTTLNDYLTPLSNNPSKRDLLDYIFEGTESMLCGPQQKPFRTAKLQRKYQKVRESLGKASPRMDHDLDYISSSSRSQVTSACHVTPKVDRDEKSCVSRQTESTVSGPDLDAVKKVMETALSETSFETSGDRSISSAGQNKLTKGFTDEKSGTYLLNDLMEILKDSDKNLLEEEEANLQHKRTIKSEEQNAILHRDCNSSISVEDAGYENDRPSSLQEPDGSVDVDNVGEPEADEDLRNKPREKEELDHEQFDLQKEANNNEGTWPADRHHHKKPELNELLRSSSIEDTCANLASPESCCSEKESIAEKDNSADSQNPESDTGNSLDVTTTSLLPDAHVPHIDDLGHQALERRIQEELNAEPSTDRHFDTDGFIRTEKCAVSSALLIDDANTLTEDRSINDPDPTMPLLQTTSSKTCKRMAPMPPTPEVYHAAPFRLKSRPTPEALQTQDRVIPVLRQQADSIQELSGQENDSFQTPGCITQASLSEGQQALETQCVNINQSVALSDCITDASRREPNELNKIEQSSNFENSIDWEICCDSNGTEFMTKSYKEKAVDIQVSNNDAELNSIPKVLSPLATQTSFHGDDSDDEEIERSKRCDTPVAGSSSRIVDDAVLHREKSGIDSSVCNPSYIIAELCDPMGLSTSSGIDRAMKPVCDEGEKERICQSQARSVASESHSTGTSCLAQDHYHPRIPDCPYFLPSPDESKVDPVLSLQSTAKKEESNDTADPPEKDGESTDTTHSASDYTNLTRKTLGILAESQRNSEPSQLQETHDNIINMSHRPTPVVAGFDVTETVPIVVSRSVEIQDVSSALPIIQGLHVFPVMFDVNSRTLRKFSNPTTSINDIESELNMQQQRRRTYLPESSDHKPGAVCNSLFLESDDVSATVEAPSLSKERSQLGLDNASLIADQISNNRSHLTVSSPRDMTIDESNRSFTATHCHPGSMACARTFSVATSRQGSESDAVSIPDIEAGGTKIFSSMESNITIGTAQSLGSNGIEPPVVYLRSVAPMFSIVSNTSSCINQSATASSFTYPVLVNTGKQEIFPGEVLDNRNVEVASSVGIGSVAPIFSNVSNPSDSDIDQTLSVSSPLLVNIGNQVRAEILDVGMDHVSNEADSDLFLRSASAISSNMSNHQSGVNLSARTLPVLAPIVENTGNRIRESFPDEVIENANVEVAYTFSSESRTRIQDKSPMLFLAISEEVLSQLHHRDQEYDDYKIDSYTSNAASNSTAAPTAVHIDGFDQNTVPESPESEWSRRNSSSKTDENDTSFYHAERNKDLSSNDQKKCESVTIDSHAQVNSSQMLSPLSVSHGTCNEQDYVADSNRTPPALEELSQTLTRDESNSPLLNLSPKTGNREYVDSSVADEYEVLSTAITYVQNASGAMSHRDDDATAAMLKSARETASSIAAKKATETIETEDRDCSDVDACVMQNSASVEGRALSTRISALLSETASNTCDKDSVDSVKAIEIEPQQASTSNFGLLIRELFSGKTKPTPLQLTNSHDEGEDICCSPCNGLDQIAPFKEKVNVLDVDQSNVPDFETDLGTQVQPVHHTDHKKIEASNTTSTPEYQKNVLENSKAVDEKINLLTNSDELALRRDKHEHVASDFTQQDKLNEGTDEAIRNTVQTRDVITAQSSSDDIDKYSDSTWDPSTIASSDSQLHTNDERFSEDSTVSFKISLPDASTNECSDGKNSNKLTVLNGFSSYQNSDSCSESLETDSDYSSEKPEIPFEIEIHDSPKNPSSDPAVTRTMLNYPLEENTIKSFTDKEQEYAEDFSTSKSDDVAETIELFKSLLNERRRQAVSRSQIDDKLENSIVERKALQPRSRETEQYVECKEMITTPANNLQKSMSSETLAVEELLVRYDNIVQNISALDLQKRKLLNFSNAATVDEDSVNIKLRPPPEYFGEETILLPSNDSEYAHKEPSAVTEYLHMTDTSSEINARTITSIDLTNVLSHEFVGESLDAAAAKSTDLVDVASQQNGIENCTDLTSVSTEDSRIGAKRSIDVKSVNVTVDSAYKGTESSIDLTGVNSTDSDKHTRNEVNSGNVFQQEIAATNYRIPTKNPTVSFDSGRKKQQIDESADLKNKDTKRSLTSVENERSPISTAGSLEECGQPNDIDTREMDCAAIEKSTDGLLSGFSQLHTSESTQEGEATKAKLLHFQERLQKRRLSRSNPVVAKTSALQTDMDQQKHEINKLFSHYDEIVKHMIVLDDTRLEQAKSRQLHHRNGSFNTVMHLQSESGDHKSIKSTPTRLNTTSSHMGNNSPTSRHLNHDDLSSCNAAQALAGSLMSQNSKVVQRIGREDDSCKSSSLSQRLQTMKTNVSKSGVSDSNESKEQSNSSTSGPLNTNIAQRVTHDESNSYVSARNSQQPPSVQDGISDDFILQMRNDKSSTSGLTDTLLSSSESQASQDIFSKFDMLLSARVKSSPLTKRIEQPGDSQHVGASRGIELVENKKLYTLAMEGVVLPSIAISSPTLSNVSSFVHVSNSNDFQSNRSSSPADKEDRQSPSLSNDTFDRRLPQYEIPSRSRHESSTGTRSQKSHKQQSPHFSTVHSRRTDWMYRHQDETLEENDSKKMIALAKLDIHYQDQQLEPYHNEKGYTQNRAGSKIAKQEYVFEPLPSPDESNEGTLNAFSDTTATDMEIQMEYSEDDVNSSTVDGQLGSNEPKNAPVPSVILDSMVQGLKNVDREDIGEDAMSSPRFVLSSSCGSVSSDEGGNSEVQMKRIESIIHGLRSTESEITTPKSGWTSSGW